MQIASFWRRGIPPIAGGFLDQTDSIIAGCTFIWAEQAEWRAKKGVGTEAF